MAHTLSSKDYRKVLEIVETAHTVADRTKMIHAVFDQLHDLVGFSSAACVPMDLDEEVLLAGALLIRNVDPSTHTLFFSHYHSLHPQHQARLPWTTRNQSCRLSDTIPTSRLVHTEYGTDFQPLVPYRYELGQTLVSQGQPVASISLMRRKEDRDFSTRDTAVMDLLLPHLAQALHNITLMETIADNQDGGIIVVKPPQVEPLFINETARRILNGRPWTVIPDPGISDMPTFFRTESGTYRLLKKTSHSAHGESILILEATPSNGQLRTKLAELNLTPRQEEIALLTLRGYSNREMAAHCCVTEQTVKDHLRDIFEKAQVRTRSRFIARVLGLQI